MSTIKIGHARYDENGEISGGDAGDQTGEEVAITSMYTHSLGWYILRPKSASDANALAEKMTDACGNDHIGYDNDNRLAIISAGIDTAKDTECDCSSLVRECIIEAMGTDPGNFKTGTEVSKLSATGLFEDKISYKSQSSTPVYNGDVLVTKSSGHTCIVVSGNPRDDDEDEDGYTDTLVVDGSWGQLTTKRMQTELGDLDVDGEICHQLTSYQEYLEAVDEDSWEFVSSKKGGSLTAMAIQALVGATEDGYIGQKTVKKLQTWLNNNNSAGLVVDGYMGTKTVKQVQKALNKDKFEA